MPPADAAAWRAFWRDVESLLVALDRGAGAGGDFSEVGSPAPQDPKNSLAVAAVQARLARWDLAAERMGRLLERNPDEHWIWCLTAALRARAGDADRYGQFCRRMLDHYREANNPEIAERTAKYCLLLPLSGPELDDADRVADRAVKKATGSVAHWAIAAKGLAEYRRGRFADALAAIEKAQAAAGGDGEWNFLLPAGCVRAMALMRLGRRDEARRTLEGASTIYKANMPRELARERDYTWTDLLLCEILHHEAEALIVGAQVMPADPPARSGMPIRSNRVSP
jgi:Flp pilus assembly protein TadD